MMLKTKVLTMMPDRLRIIAKASVMKQPSKIIDLIKKSNCSPKLINRDLIMDSLWPPFDHEENYRK